MSDDPIDILKTAGVECAEVEAWATFSGYESEAQRNWTYDDWMEQLRVKSAAAILALARRVAPLARFLNAERALNDPEIMEGTTHRQTDAHVEADRAYREACVALGLDSFLEADDA